MGRPCKECGGVGHTAMMCFSNRRSPMRKNKGYLKKQGKQGVKWLKTRSRWFADHVAEFYTCYICGERLSPAETTLDHIKSRSRYPELRYEMSNLAPCCWRCNTNKGSRDIDEI